MPSTTEDGDKTTEPGPIDRSAGTAGEPSDTDYVRATAPVRNRLAWQVLIWPVAMILLIVLGAIWALS
ncbi:hypothetical protein GCM10011402_26400 [Paracoccus acridae]|uniref:Uncharacterized protein n=1 Tax=Paracoccus acridae TaxID=1795310 RepID=A0ABQ1VJC7_9RHOB|nr:hypothetical protein [Paracoccus acridae]GGF72543.1 hypothetical protein GCM10011402_26400 [Paracoccus acridae]